MTDKNKGRNQPAAGTPTNEPGQRSNKGTTRQDEQVNNPCQKKDNKNDREQKEQDFEDRQKDYLRSNPQDGTDSDHRQGQRNGGE